MATHYTAPGNPAAITRSWADHDRVLLRKKIFAISPQFHIYDPVGGLVLYCKQKLFSWKDDIRVYADTAMQHPVLTIKARRILDFSNTFDVTDAYSGELLGTFQRRGWRSLMRDHWIISDANGQATGEILEGGHWLLKRLFANFVPQVYTISHLGDVVGELRQKWNPFVFAAHLDLSMDPGRQLDRRMAMAAGLLLMAVEGRQNNER